MLNLNLQLFGGRGSGGGNNPGSKDISLQFRQTEKGVKISNPDGSTDSITLNASRVAGNYEKKKYGEIRELKNGNTLQTITTTYDYYGIGRKSVYRVTSEINLVRYPMGGSYSSQTVKSVKRIK